MEILKLDHASNNNMKKSFIVLPQIMKHLIIAHALNIVRGFNTFCRILSGASSL